MTTEPRSEPQADPAPQERRDLVQAVELLDKLIEENRNALLSDTGLKLPPMSGGFLIDTDVGGRHEPPVSLDLFDTPADEDFPDDSSEWAEEAPEDCDLEMLRQELLADLSALIDVGLRRVTDSARAVLSREFRQGQAMDSEADAEASAIATPNLSPLSQAVGDVLSRYGLADSDGGNFYRDLESELNGIVTEGLEQIRRTLEQVLQARVSARAESRLQALSAPREHQSPARVENPESNGDNPPDEVP